MISALRTLKGETRMRRLFVAISAGAICVAAIALAQAQAPAAPAAAAPAPAPAPVKPANPDEPFWAWAYPDATFRAPPAPPRDAVVKMTLPGSKQSYTEAQANDRYNPPDWYPEDHPTMPPIVAKGDGGPRLIYACALCHLTNGFGRAENANVSGLPVEYFRQQILDFRNDARKTSDPRKTNTALMTGFAKAMTDEEITQAAEYFAKIKMVPWIKVVEASTVPKTVGTGNWLTAIEGAGAGMEPIGNRIVEMPVENEEQEKWRNPRSGFVAYVPPGSLAKGKQLVDTGGGGRFAACTACHGQDLRGLGPIPPIAGRSPSYIARQLYDMQQANRLGTWTPLMSAVVGSLQPADILNVSAYVASLKP